MNWRLIDPILRAVFTGRAIFVTAAVARDLFSLLGTLRGQQGWSRNAGQDLCREIAKTSIPANRIDPGIVRTRLRAGAFPSEDPTRRPLPESVTDAFLALALPGSTRNSEVVAISNLEGLLTH
jgi:hypothetical protein